MAVFLFSILVIALGAVLGLCFRVLVLAPAIALTTLAITASAHDLTTTGLAVFGAAVLLQTGYCVGCILRVATPAQTPAQTTTRYRLPGSKAAHWT
jgi:hypothetical protein